ncbi:hypothetical protein C8R46DRAFT_1206119 [Mycena filopes]|nr:hypothetical protein C8R46DRAFT_1206119 [Mycena filopes]
MTSPLITVSRLTVADAHAAATAQVHALASPHPIQLRIQPGLLAAGTNRIVKASFIPNDDDSELLAGVAVWVLFDGKTPQLEDGVVVAPPRERTKEDEEALVGVDVEIRKRFGEISTETRDRFMGGSRYWYLSFMAVDPKYQKRGVGQALLRWGLDQADAEGLEAYLESSDDGLRLYEKNGFELGPQCDAIPFNQNFSNPQHDDDEYNKLPLS